MNLKTLIKLVALMFFFGPLPSVAEDYIFETDAPVYAVGDVHGAFGELFALLRGIELIDDAGRWIGGEAHLVSLGDLVDRGPNSKSAMDLLMRLQGEARTAGGRVHVLLGNHELMNLGGDLRDVSQAEFAALGGEDGHTEAFSKDGTYGAWLRARPVAIRINDTLFAHGGFSSLARIPLVDLNDYFWRATNRVIAEGQKLQANGLLSHDHSLLDPSVVALESESASSPLKNWHDAARSAAIGTRSLVWYRGNVACHPLIEAQNIASVLSANEAKRIVVGHTPTRSREVESRFGGQVVAIDTGMLNAVYRGAPRALKINGGGLTVLTADGEAKPTLNVDDVQPSANELIERNQKSAKKEAAAFILSAYLDLDLVLPTRVAEGGIFRAKENVITERTRQERQLYRPNYCEYESDFDLLAAFDSLIGKRDRTMDNLAYRRANWDIVALDNGNAFDTSTRMPTYPKPPVLNGTLRQRLEALDTDTLHAQLGHLLRSREISAILKRRDIILNWPGAS